jgi:BON domain
VRQLILPSFLAIKSPPMMAPGLWWSATGSSACRSCAEVSSSASSRARYHACSGEPRPGGEDAVGDDAAIREQILAECSRQSWAPMTNVVVRNGVVELWGTITDDRERQALIAACENVPGVRAVHDHLVWIEPNSGFAIQSEEDEAPTPATS